MSTLSDALAYARRGWLVVPLHNPKQGKCSCRKAKCGSPGKHPRTEHGLKDGSKDGGQIEQWFSCWPDANLGILTGQESGLVVLDVDGEDGKSSFQLLTTTYGPLPKTLCVKTGRTGTDGGRKGCHYYFRAPAGTIIRNSAGTLGKGLDVRGEGGYVVAPPSLHPSGLLYEWLNPFQPLADLPSWLQAKLAETKPTSAPGAEQLQSSIAEGGRNAALASLGGTMRRRGMSTEAIANALLAENLARCNPPLPEDEVRAIAQSVARYEPAPIVHPIAPLTAEGTSAARQWPAPLSEAAYYGLPGEFVRLAGPHTEADPAALLFQYLAAIGAAIGRGPHYRVGADRHYTNLFVVLVGNSSKARKGTSWGEVARLLSFTDIEFSKTRVSSGLTSGEGLIDAVRDEIREMVPIKEKGRVVDYEEQVTDAGEKDKRLLCVEGEFAQTLHSTREGSTLSPVIRQAWDGSQLRVMAKKSKAACTEPHISIIGHITNTELQLLLSKSDAQNGFANRFLWVGTTRSKCLPFGGENYEEDLRLYCDRLRDAVTFARTIGEVAWTPDAAQLWERISPALSEGRPGHLGSIISRGEAQVMRMALIYAVLDHSAELGLAHLEAALELWRYAEESAAYIFGNSLGNPVADALVALVREHPEGVTRTQLNAHFGRNKSKEELDRALAEAQANGRVRLERRQTSGRPTEVILPVNT